jgi:Tol biopolymer transport system component
LSFVEKNSVNRSELLSSARAVIGASRLNSGRCAFALLLLSLAAIGIAPAQNTTLPASTIFRFPWTSGESDDQPPTSTPDGRTMLFQRSDGHSSKIFESHLIDGDWSTPALASFSGSWSDQFPAMSPDGSYLIFESDRPFTAGGGSTDRIGNLWRVDRTASGWSAPMHLPDSVNISKRIYGHSVAANGDIYFMSTTEPRGKEPKWRLFRAVRTADGYAQAEALPFSDGSTSDVDPYVAPDQSYLIFSSEKRRQPTGHEHLFIAFHSGADWGPVVPIRYRGDEQAEDDNYSDVSADGKTLYFESTAGDKSIVKTLPLAPYLLAVRSSGSKP